MTYLRASTDSWRNRVEDAQSATTKIQEVGFAQVFLTSCALAHATLTFRLRNCLLFCASQHIVLSWFGDWRRHPLPFLGVSSLNFGPLATAAFFLSAARLPAPGRVLFS